MTLNAHQKQDYPVLGRKQCSVVCTCASVPQKAPYRSSPGVVTGAVLYHISPQCLFVQQHLRASPPLTAARLSLETDAYPAQTG